MGKTALLIIDMQNDFCLPGAPFEVSGALKVAAKIKEALEACRKNGLPIVHVIRHYRPDGSDVEITRYEAFLNAGGALIPGSKGAKIIEELKPIEGEYLIVKQRWSAFFQTELDILLKRLGVDQVVITGVQTPNCIRGTVWDANSLDYEVIVLTDGTGAKTPEVHEANLFDMKNIGVKLMTTEEFIKSLPAPPKENLIAKIRGDIEKKKE
ncbi:Maleamate amidohydrolase [Neomoorella glycerini]|uniref:Maleamate amidohydrolase n=1 Tax=Neomoorella glycerini TaxID=55779 RepID=A0A6I5ZQS1_9FIRM|nr:isochorismatase family cysteine hydrolase [Moorella glycerini]QGP91999.1 Maleamate amidohydrolase [Moorella glycerini]